MSQVILTPYRKPKVVVPPFPYFAALPFLVPSDWDTAAKVISISDGQMTSNVDNDIVQIGGDANDFHYLFSPASNGTITFQNLSFGAPGAFDGATWGFGDVEGGTGPVSASLDFGLGPELWYMYRSDFEGLGVQGVQNWRLKFDRPQ